MRTTMAEMMYHINSRAIRRARAERRAAIMQFLFEDYPGVVVIGALVGLALAGGIINNIG